MYRIGFTRRKRFLSGSHGCAVGWTPSWRHHQASDAPHPDERIKIYRRHLEILLRNEEKCKKLLEAGIGKRYCERIWKW